MSRWVAALLPITEAGEDLTRDASAGALDAVRRTFENTLTAHACSASSKGRNLATHSLSTASSARSFLRSWYLGRLNRAS